METKSENKGCNVPVDKQKIRGMRILTSPLISRVSLFDQLRRSLASFHRDPRFSQVTDFDIRFFKDVVGDAGVITDPHQLQPMNTYVFISFPFPPPFRLHNTL